MVAPDHLAVADHEQLEAGLRLLASDPDHVLLRAGVGGDLLLLDGPLDRAQLVAGHRSGLVPKSVRLRRHLTPQLVRDPLLLAVQEIDNAIDGASIVGLGDGLDTGRLAAVDVIEQAGPLEDALPLRDVQVAGAKREDLAQQLERLVHARGGRVGPEVTAPVTGQLSGADDAREVLAQGDLDEGVALVVAQPDIEARPMLLDQVVLEEVGLADGVGHDVLDVRDLGHHPLDARVVGRTLPEVRAHAVAKDVGLANVQHASTGALHEVDTRGSRQLPQDGAQVRVAIDAGIGGRHGPILGRCRAQPWGRPAQPAGVWEAVGFGVGIGLASSAAR